MRLTINSGPCQRHRIPTRRYILKTVVSRNLINCGADLDHYENRRRALKIGLGKKISPAESIRVAVHISFVETFGTMGQFLFFSFLFFLQSFLCFFLSSIQVLYSPLTIAWYLTATYDLNLAQSQICKGSL